MNTNYYQLQKYLIFLIPIGLIFSIFIADLSLILFSLIFLIDQIKKKNLVSLFNKYSIFFLIFWIYLLINSTLSFDPNLSFSRSIGYLRFGIFFMALSFFLNFDDIKRNLLLLVLFLSILLIIDSVFQFFTGYNMFGYEAHISRVSSFFKDELVLGGFLLRLYPIFLISIFYLKINKIFSLLLFIFYFFTIFISGERTAFFNFILLNLILIIIFFERKYLKYIIISSLILVTFMGFTYFKQKHILDRYIEVKNLFKDGEIILFSETHQRHYKSAYKIFNENKFFGSGLKTFRKICKEVQYYPEGCTTHPHNILMQFLSELGLIGLLFYLLLCLFLIKKLIFYYLLKLKYKLKSSNTQKFQLIIIASIIINLSPLSPYGNFFNNWLSILNFLVISFFIYHEKKLMMTNLKLPQPKEKI